MIEEKENFIENATWYIVGLKPQDVNYEIPMPPQVLIRNALGIDEGGSDVKFDRKAYDKSVAFFEKNVAIKVV